MGWNRLVRIHNLNLLILWMAYLVTTRMISPQKVIRKRYLLPSRLWNTIIFFGFYLHVGRCGVFARPISICHIRFSFSTMGLLSPNPVPFYLFLGNSVPFYSFPIRILFCWLMAIFLLFLNHMILIHKYRDSATARMLSYPRLLCQILWKWAVWIFNQNTFSTS